VHDILGRMIVTALTLHVLSATVWVGGMFAAYLCLRPAAGALEPPQRLKLWRAFLRRFFLWVWASAILLVATGYWMLVTHFGGFAGAPPYVDIMQALGWLMILLFVLLFHGPWLKFKRAVASLNHIRIIIAMNLPLGLIVVVVGGTGRYWAF
jgi:uncharacterized membrane protein